ncbi:MAG: glycosyltransferase [Verrucomicrobia bacterium]|nr:MAG: glycosyltransferase [Verrucomicrobiota bacterium]
MPRISLVVCVFQEGDLLARLLQHAAGLYDDLVVVHDGPDETNVRALVEKAGGKFFEAPRDFQQEPHWPLAWGKAAHDWILRLDADELPSEAMRDWLKKFRAGAEPPENISGFTCVWPLWNGTRAVSRRWPAGRHFLFHRQRVRFFGMVEQTPVPDGAWETTDLVLHHQPKRKSYGLVNLIFRKQAYRWRARIARSLLDEPAALNCWRWENRPWPVSWQDIRQHPFRTAFLRLTRDFLRTLRDQWRREGRIFPFAAISGPVHHTLIAIEYCRLRRLKARGRLDENTQRWAFK